MLRISDNIKELGFSDIHYVYSGRGYHLRILNKELLHTSSVFISELVNYVLATEVPEPTIELQHFIIPFEYSKIYTDWFKYTVNRLDANKRYSGLDENLKNSIIQRRELVNTNQWGILRGEINPIKYYKLTHEIAEIHKQLCDSKVSIDTKRILRLPVHYTIK